MKIKILIYHSSAYKYYSITKAHNIIGHDQNKIIFIKYDFGSFGRIWYANITIAASLATISTISKPKFIHNM